MKPKYGIVIVEDNGTVRPALATLAKNLVADRADNGIVLQFGHAWELEPILAKWRDENVPAFGIVDLVPSDFWDKKPKDAPYIVQPRNPPDTPIEVPAVARYMIEHYLSEYVKNYDFRPIVYTFVFGFLREQLPNYEGPLRDILSDAKLSADLVEKTELDSESGAWVNDLPELERKLRELISAKLDAGDGH